MAGDSVIGGGRVQPPKRGFFRKWGRRLAFVITLGAAGTGAVKHGPDVYNRVAYRNDPSVVAASSEKKPGVRKARALQDGAIKIRDAFIKHVDETHKAGRFKGKRNKRFVKKGVEVALGFILKSEEAFVKGNLLEAKKLLMAAELELDKSEASIDRADPFQWPGEERDEARTKISKLRKIVAAIMAAFGL